MQTTDNDPHSSNPTNPPDELKRATTGAGAQIALPEHSRQALLRLLKLLLGLGAMVVGLHLMRADAPYRPDLLQSINQYFRLDFNNLGNVLQGILFLALGAVLASRAFPSPSWLTGEGRQPASWQLGWPSLRPDRRWLLVGVAANAVTTIQLGTTGYQPLSLVLWLFSLIILTTVMFHWDGRRGQQLLPDLSKTDGYLILGLTLLAVTVYAYRIRDVPSVLLGDEAAFFQHANDLRTDLSLFTPFGFATYSFPALGTYVQCFFLWVFKPSLWSWRMGSAIPAALAIPGLYLLAKLAYERRVAILACLLYASLPFAMSFARLGYNSAQVMPLVAAGAGLFLLASRHRSAGWLFVSGIVAGLGFLTYTAGRILAVTVFAYFFYRAYLALRARRSTREDLLAMLVFGAAILLVIAPHVVYGLRAQTEGLVWKVGESSLTNIQYVRDFFPEQFVDVGPSTASALGHDQLIDLGLTARIAVRGTLRTALAYVLGGFFQQHFLIGPLAGGIGALFLPLGLLALFGTMRRASSLFFLLWFFLAFFLLSALNTYPPRPSHLVGMLPLIPLLVALGLTLSIDALVAALPRLGQAGMLLIMTAATLAMAMVGLRAYFVTMPQEYRPDIESAISWAGLANPDRLYVYAHTEPAREQFIPYLFLEVEPGVRYQNLLLGPQAAQLLDLPLDEKVELFVEEKDFDLVRQPLRERWGTNLQLKTYYDPEGNARIRLLANGAFGLEDGGSFIDHLAQSYFVSPFKWLLLAFAAVAAAIRVGTAPLTGLWPRLLKGLIWITEPPSKPK